METVESIVIGAGVVGLAIARVLAYNRREVLVVESADKIGTGISSRNSEVVHSGIYYRPGSKMARLCVDGRNALYSYCLQHGVAFEKCGKMIVSTSAAEQVQLDQIAKRAKANGVDDLHFLSSNEARLLEPELACTAAILSPSTGIVDSYGFMSALQADAEASGAIFVFSAPFERASAYDDGFVVQTGGETPYSLGCKYLINSAGLHASTVALNIQGLPVSCVPKGYMAKGTYFALAGAAPFRRLIYPVPVPGGLGIHLTLDLAHQVKFGPDVEWIDTIDYRVDSSRVQAFYTAIRQYWPTLPHDKLRPAYCGIRPKIVPPNAPAQDFIIQGPNEHGVNGLVNLFGIESPGLTASLAIAQEVLNAATFSV